MAGVTPIGRRGIGQFAQNTDPQNVGPSALTGLFSSTLHGNAHRVAHSMAGQSRRWTGTGLTFQSFVRTHGGVNSADALDVHANAPLKRNRSRALGQHKGQPWMGTEDPLA